MTYRGCEIVEGPDGLFGFSLDNSPPCFWVDALAEAQAMIDWFREQAE